MLLLSLSPVVLAFLTSNALAARHGLDCGDAGCLSLLANKLPSVDVTAYKESFRNRVTTLTISTYRSTMVAAVIRPFQNVDELVDPSIPAVCRPSAFKNYRNFVDKRKFEKQSQDAATKSDCCVHCHTVGDCFAYEFDPIKSQCNFYVTKEQLDVESQSEVCPAGKGAGYLELPNYPLWPNHYGHEAGPCLRDIDHPRHKMDHGIDVVGHKDSPDQAILDAQRDSNRMSDDDEEDDDYEL